jgi:hypothetical protein
MALGRLAAFTAVACLACGSAGAQVQTIVTTPAGSFTNSLGSAIAKVIVEKAGIKATVSAQQSHGHEAVNDGAAQLSVVTIPTSSNSSPARSTGRAKAKRKTFA